ncbi:DUF3515 domain-containing protein [Rothia sp. AR01]|uniref:DUF3515 domain-containing protein n=1 Tax=Rothia santali TaxID=2949643 RepID=A0A9X2HL35_9MICC|nr:DUF3515 family protein [Rothia santali]MCP3426253.1 DUF3515 domain-containing protein [Rothia santali]
MRNESHPTASPGASSLGSDAENVQGRSYRPRSHRWTAAAGAVGLTLLVSSCAGAVTVTPAPDAANPDCASAMVAMPGTLAGFDQRETTAQATSAWGDPAAVILKCGVTVERPVADPCVSVNGVDWVLKREDDDDSAQADDEVSRASGTWTATTFGREPALQATFDADRVSSSSLLVELESAAQRIPQTQQCLSVDQSLEDLPDSGS